jgi:hypothetical protein
MESKRKGAGFRRDQFHALVSRLGEPRRFIQVVAGPRQVGKTTLVRQVLDALPTPSHYASADGPAPGDAAWIERQWEAGRALARTGDRRGAILALDEVQKISGWSESVKKCWDEDTAAKTPLRAVLLGSAPLLVQRGLTESLAGRFEVIRLPHWSFSEMRQAFAWDVDRFVYFGGYPGGAPLIEDEERWVRYILDSLVETTVSRDILLMTRVDKPALLRRVFFLACEYSGQILSYQKMLGQLTDAGNTTTIAHYLDLLAGAGMASGLQKFAGQRVRSRSSSPKLQVLNTGLMSAHFAGSFASAREEPQIWGRLVESAIGAHLLNTVVGTDVGVHYWREANREVDFVLTRGRAVAAIEVKSGKGRAMASGLADFSKLYPSAKLQLVGADGVPLGYFLSKPAVHWLESEEPPQGASLKA